MRLVTSRRLFLFALLVTATSAILMAAPILAPSHSMHDAFIAENDQAMKRMMAGMHVSPSGDIDRDFAMMMIPHHQGAIDMAVAELRYGSNPLLRRLAQEIIVEQQQEIRVMQMILEERLGAPPGTLTADICSAAGKSPAVDAPPARQHH